ncbi:hypothetical protein EG329_009003 [Mollisiaceae sp. DMI_Dod_QoI]|nr:hypothetical protein EG329_009003 [Helotiales sp. DMI_Dod_QoI]
MGSLRVFIHGIRDSGFRAGDNIVLEEKRLKWTEQIASALRFLHENGIMHTDTSTANTLITDNLDIVICDFSSSILHGKGSENVSRCTRRYRFFDEVWDGNWSSFGKGKERDARSYGVKDDIWGLGTVCYEMWCRKRLWEEFEERERVKLYWRGEWPSLEKAGDMGRVIRECWVDGYESAGAVLEELKGVDDNESFGSSPSLHCAEDMVTNLPK